MFTISIAVVRMVDQLGPQLILAAPPVNSSTHLIMIIVLILCTALMFLDPIAAGPIRKPEVQVLWLLFRI